MSNIGKTLVLGQVEILPLLNAFATFKRAMEEAKSELERDGAVQRFEYTFELTWKVLKKILAVKGLDINNPIILIKNFLIKYPNTVVYGSRVKGNNKKFSDLDICLKDSISAYEYEFIVEKFEKSDLPFRVDLTEFDKVSDSFKKIIESEGVLLSAVQPIFKS
jgi:predicted nucleotidyltransferase